MLLDAIDGLSNHNQEAQLWHQSDGCKVWVAFLEVVQLASLSNAGGPVQRVRAARKISRRGVQHLPLGTYLGAPLRWSKHR